MNTTTIPEARFRTVDGVRIRYAESDGSPEPTILLTSPWPESLYAFTPIWATLAAQAHVAAVDLPGFGQSERRDDLMSPRAMGGFLSRLITELDLGRPYVVAPDVGTAAALFAAADHPGQIAGVVVGAGGVAVPLELGEPLKSWVLDPDLEKYRQIDPHAVVNVALDTHAHGVSDEIRADYLTSYEGDRFFESMAYVRRYPEELPQLAELLPKIATPVSIIGAVHDRVVPLANAEFLAQRLPDSRLVVLDSGHFAWEDTPAEYAATVLDAVNNQPKGGERHGRIRLRRADRRLRIRRQCRRAPDGDEQRRTRVWHPPTTERGYWLGSDCEVVRKSRKAAAAGVRGRSPRTIRPMAGWLKWGSG